MTVVTVNSNQTLTIFNNGGTSAQIFGRGNNGLGSKARYDATIKVENGAGFCSAPPNYGSMPLSISGPFTSNLAYDMGVDGNTPHSYMKQGAINIGGSGGVVWLNTPNVLIGEPSGSQSNDGYDSTFTVKGITTYKAESGYTSLSTGANVKIRGLSKKRLVEV